MDKQTLQQAKCHSAGGRCCSVMHVKHLSKSFFDLHGSPGALTPAVRCAEGKRISPAAWEMLSAQHGNPPALTSDSLCRECLGQQLERATQGRRGDELREEMLEIAIRLLDGSSSAASDFLISKSWLL